MGGRKRISASRVVVWTEALAFLKERRRRLLLAMWAPGLAIVLVNLPWFETAWVSGFLTAAILATVAGVLLWIAWVVSGLAFRIQGAIAEDWSAELFRSLPTVYGVIPSWKYDGGDIDHIVLTPRFILAVETKWRSTEISEYVVSAAVAEAEKGAQRLRKELHSWHEPLGTVPVVPMVLMWGPRVPTDLDRKEASDVESVRVLAEEATRRRLEPITSGSIGPDFAEGLLRRLDDKARERDERRIKAGWLVRRLSRAA